MNETEKKTFSAPSPGELESLHIGSIKAHLFLGENVDGQVGQVEVFQLHIADVVGVGDFRGVGVSLAVRPRFSAVAGLVGFS